MHGTGQVPQSLDEQVPPSRVGQFVAEQPPQLFGRQRGERRLRKENPGKNDTCQGRSRVAASHKQCDGPPHSHFKTASVEQSEDFFVRHRSAPP